MPFSTGFVNTREFSPYALGKEVSPSLKDKYAYRIFWEEQLRRCMDGYSVAGVKITGPHYDYLNFKKIIRVISGKSGRKGLESPRFTDLDYDFFWAYHNGRYVYKKRGMAVTGSRQRGKTYKSASLGSYELTFYPKSQTLVVAQSNEFADDTFRKIKDYQLQYEGTPFFKRHSIWNDGMIQTGFKITDPVSKEDVPRGFFSEAHKLIAKNNPQCTIGKTPSLVLREEAGKFNNYRANLDYMKMQLEAEGEYTAFVLDFGTGGDMTKGGSEGLRNNFYGKDDDDYYMFDEDWDEDGNFFTGKGTKIGFFIPAHRGMVMDENGNSLIKESIIKLKANREESMDDPEKYAVEVSQAPIIPSESFWIAGSNVFPTILLNKRLANIQRSRELSNIIQKGDLEWVRDPKGYIQDVEFHPNRTTGKHQVLEHPEWLWPADKRKIKVEKANGWNIYLSGCDSYDADNSTTDSVGSFFVYKKMVHADATHDLFVHQFTGRPNAEDFFEETAKANWYYKSKMLFEATNLGIKNWYLNHHLVQFLKERPEVAYSNIKDSRADYQYGLQMPEPIKNYCIGEMNKWIKVYHNNLFFQDQIQDLCSFTRETNHDRSMASMLCIVNSLDAYRFMEDEKEVIEDHSFVYTHRNEHGLLVTSGRKKNNF